MFSLITALFPTLAGHSLRSPGPSRPRMIRILICLLLPAPLAPAEDEEKTRIVAGKKTLSGRPGA